MVGKPSNTLCRNANAKATRGSFMIAMLDSTVTWPLRNLVGTVDDDDVCTEDLKRYQFIDRFEL